MINDNFNAFDLYLFAKNIQYSTISAIDKNWTMDQSISTDL
jgi:hypothetical protein